MTTAATAKKPRLAVFKFASCDGCQLQLLDAEGQLRAIADQVEIDHFLEARSRSLPGPYDIGLVEGSISTPADIPRILEIRRQCRFLVTIGACATSGGIQALRNWGQIDDFLGAVYATPAYVQSLEKSTAIADHVPVDFELRGCPIDTRQLVELVTAVVVGRKPRVPTYSVCVECKMRGTVCVAVARGIACLGPVTQAGCDALCPAHDRECFGCFGPSQQPNLVSLNGFYERQGASRERLGRRRRRRRTLFLCALGESDTYIHIHIRMYVDVASARALVPGVIV
jgi:coenzyme F420-reducing hydrogenase gamma subunit